ncbi:NAD(P)-dependent oxidoreductase [Mucilaginibacter gotjawali]|uniref:3-hydroxyisobutyrate dehydrogenase n=1 Tax=Mucilaginibacter gotjawali TaxID=1550579 RepID=A0A839SMX6_9SPHI|nr:NAD(P)-dependent oxidoreductase [Mucilaginibacter gotjawali]MBB3058942.1 3-hydroxyisobutyrate dehydrogenase [Mucilaginibacter gotjawali]
MKAFLGMGLLGSNFVKAMINKGEQVQVWNRTASRAKVLEAFGAKAFDSAADAVKGADVVHLCVKDDAAVDQVLEQAAPGFYKGVYIIDHTTTSAKGAVERTKAWKARGFIYLHAPVFMGPPNALASTGTMLVSGDQTVIAKMEPELSKMTGKLLNLGDVEGKAAGMKLIGNLFLIALTGALSDTLAMGKAQGITGDDILGLFDTWNPGAMTVARLKRIMAGGFDDPSWELSMARKDAGLMMSAANEGGTDLLVIPAIAAEMDKWIEQGHGDKDWTVFTSPNI